MIHTIHRNSVLWHLNCGGEESCLYAALNCCAMASDKITRLNLSRHAALL
jgi:hypothetical protein